MGTNDAIQGNKEGLATVTGIVDGTGSIGAALGQILVPLIQVSFNWGFVFYFFIILVIFIFFRNAKYLKLNLILH